MSDLQTTSEGLLQAITDEVQTYQAERRRIRSRKIPERQMLRQLLEIEHAKEMRCGVLQLALQAFGGEADSDAAVAAVPQAQVLVDSKLADVAARVRHARAATACLPTRKAAAPAGLRLDEVGKLLAASAWRRERRHARPGDTIFTWNEEAYVGRVVQRSNVMQVEQPATRQAVQHGAAQQDSAGVHAPQHPSGKNAYLKSVKRRILSEEMRAPPSHPPFVCHVRRTFALATPHTQHRLLYLVLAHLLPLLVAQWRRCPTWPTSWRK
jgi:hypothetical protein